MATVWTIADNCWCSQGLTVACPEHVDRCRSVQRPHIPFPPRVRVYSRVTAWSVVLWCVLGMLVHMLFITAGVAEAMPRSSCIACVVRDKNPNQWEAVCFFSLRPGSKITNHVPGVIYHLWPSHSVWLVGAAIRYRDQRWQYKGSVAKNKQETQLMGNTQKSLQSTSVWSNISGVRWPLEDKPCNYEIDKRRNMTMTLFKLNAG